MLAKTDLSAKASAAQNTVDDINPALPRTLNYGNYGIFLIMGRLMERVAFTLASGAFRVLDA